MTDRDLAGSQFSTNCERKTIKAFRGYKSKRFSDRLLEVNCNTDIFVHSSSEDSMQGVVAQPRSWPAHESELPPLLLQNMD